jgi:hypothetical protein
LEVKILYSPGKGSVSVKEISFGATAGLTGKGHAAVALSGQALAGAMQPNLVRALIQRGALR